jgi:hypothetical protein
VITVPEKEGRKDERPGRSGREKDSSEGDEVELSGEAGFSEWEERMELGEVIVVAIVFSFFFPFLAGGVWS